MDTQTNSSHHLPLSILRFAPVRMALLYVLLTYLYLSGFFFKASMTHGPVQSLLATVLMCALMLACYAAVVHFVERRPVSELALPGRGREFGIGLLLGVGLYSVCVLILMVLGYYRVEGMGSWQALLPGLAIALGTGVYEELWFRGSVFRLLEEWFGSWLALAASSLVFGLVHLSTEGATLRDALFISVEAGVLLAGAYMLTRRLWLSIGFHIAWNFTQGSVFSGSVSGNEAPKGLIEATIEGPVLLTGGSFGMEASLIAFVLLTTTGVIMLVMAVRRGTIVPPLWKRGA